MNLGIITQDCKKINENMQEKLHSMAKIETCVSSLLSEGRLFCNKRKLRLV